MAFDPDVKIPIAMTLGGSKNIRMQVHEASFREFGEFCSKPKKGSKHEAYFTRGVPEFEDTYTSRSGHMYTDGHFRHDSAIKQADFLIIDADNSNLSAKRCHNKLTALKIAHFIYTSHSHSRESNNYRVVIPCKMKNKEELKATAHKIIDDVNNRIIQINLGLNYVKEMGTWSQSWYLPTRDDPDDGIFEYYEYMEGDAYEATKIQTTEGLDGESLDTDSYSMDNTDTSSDSQTIAELTEIARTYGEGCHHAILKLSWGFKEDGMSEKTAVTILKGLMHEHKDRDERTKTRFGDIERIVSGAFANSKTIKFGVQSGDRGTGDGSAKQIRSTIGTIGIETDAVQNVDDIPWPPGMMGELSQSVYDFSLYPNRTISVVTSLGLIAGIAGRRFNISGGGLNLYMTLLMETGGGKSVISKYINRVLNNSALFAGASNFTGSSRYTGPKALMDDLHSKRCFVSVFTEAGFMFRSKAGDQDGLTRAILDLYGSSGVNNISVGSSYSSDKNSIKSVVSPCFSMINESTPDIFLQALKDGAKTGEINRMNIFRVDYNTENGSHVMNRNAKFELNDKLSAKIGDLMGRCNNTQEKDDPEATIFHITDEMYLFADEMKRNAIRLKDDDYVKSSMMHRSAEKTFKLAALCTVLNNRGPKGSRFMDVDKDAWEWAVMMHEHEMSSLQAFFKVDSTDDIFRTIAEHLYPFIQRLFNNRYKSNKLSLSRVDIAKNRIPVYILRQVTKHCKPISALGNSKYGKSGLDVAIKYLSDQGFCKIKHIGNRNTKYLVFNENILELEDYH